MPIAVSLSKAKVITKDRLRADRAPLLESQDILFMNNANQVGTQALTDSHNISSISDIGTGKTRFTFANAMANVDYACVASIRAEATEAEHVNFAQHATGSVDIFNVYRFDGAGAVFVDSQQLSMITFGD